MKKGKWFVLEKVIKSRCNYYKLIIHENQGELNILNKDSTCNIEKKALKRSNKEKNIIIIFYHEKITQIKLLI